jgi:aldose 1-epimerase
MVPIVLSAGRLVCAVDAGLGGALTGLWVRAGHLGLAPILRPTPPGVTSPFETSLYVLAPWSNRIAGAVFRFDGEEHRLRANFPDGSAIHGDVLHRPLRIADRSPVSVRLVHDSRVVGDSNFPFPYAAELRYELSPSQLEIDLSVTNLGQRDMPAGCGLHPFFSRRVVSDADEVRVRAPVSGRYPAKDCIPTGPAVEDAASRRLSAGGPLGDPGLDDTFAGFGGLGGGRAVIDWPQSGLRAVLQASRELSHLVVYTPRCASGDAALTGREGPASWFCVEPVTMATDAFNLAHRGDAVGETYGVRVLGPGETLSTRTRIVIEATPEGPEGPGEPLV